MIYADFVEKKENSVIYSYWYGKGEHGLIEFPLYKKGTPIVLKKPEEDYGWHWIGNLYYKYHKDFLNGKTPEKIAYEC